MVQFEVVLRQQGHAEHVGIGVVSESKPVDETLAQIVVECHRWHPTSGSSLAAETARSLTADSGTQAAKPANGMTTSSLPDSCTPSEIEVTPGCAITWKCSPKARPPYSRRCCAPSPNNQSTPVAKMQSAPLERLSLRPVAHRLAWSGSSSQSPRGRVGPYGAARCDSCDQYAERLREPPRGLQAMRNSEFIRRARGGFTLIREVEERFHNAPCVRQTGLRCRR